ncbi:MAG: sensor histidine kinase, partial [Halolamina sp.]
MSRTGTGQDADQQGRPIRARLATRAVSAVGVALLSIPVYDIWDDVSDLGWSVVPTLMENSVLIALALLLAFGGVWLGRQEWSESDAVLTAKWTVGGAIALTGVYVLIILLQLQEMGGLKPYLLAADGVLIGTVAAFGVGLYDVRRRQSHREQTGERDRFRAFFENTDLCIAILDSRNGELAATEANPAFDETFAVGFEDLLSAAEPMGDGTFDRDQFVRAALDDGQSHQEIRVPSETLTPQARENGQERFYDLQTVRITEDETLAVFSDTTAERERDRLLSERPGPQAGGKSEREQQLEERTDQLEFLHSLLRHDVQNGMMVIDSRAEHLREELDGREAEFAGTIVSRAREISDQIDRIRTALNTLTEGTETDAVHLTELLETRVATFRDSYPAVELRTDIEDSLRVEADNILDDVIANLLRNAVEHNDKDRTEVELTAAATGDSVRIEVADNGPGIPEEHREEVLQRGVSGGNADGAGGSGFGLFFIDTMVESYGGDIRIEDNEPEGTRFIIELRTP